MRERTCLMFSVAALLLTWGLSVSMQAGTVDYKIPPLWDNTQTDEFGRYTHTDGGQWFLGRNTQDSKLFVFPTEIIPGDVRFMGPTYQIPPPVGDYNEDGANDIQDFGIFAAQFGCSEDPTEKGQGPSVELGCANVDLTGPDNPPDDPTVSVDIEDFGVYAGHFGEQGRPQWGWLNPGTGSNSGNARFTGTTIETDAINNQFPGMILIFQAPETGNYSIKGKAAWEWFRTNHPDDDPANTGVPNPDQASQLRFQIKKWTPGNNVKARGTDADHPGSGVFGTGELRNADACPDYPTPGPSGPCGADIEALFTSSDLKTNYGLDQDPNGDGSGGTFELDLGTVAEIQDIPLNEDDFLAIISRNRGILSLHTTIGEPPLTLETAVFDNQIMRLGADLDNLVRIQGPAPAAGPTTTPEPMSLLLLVGAGIPLAMRRRRG